MSELVRESFRVYTEQQIRRRFEAGHEYGKKRNPRGYREEDVPRLIKEVRKELTPEHEAK